MKLSEAIRKGCEMTTPLKGSLFAHFPDENAVSACAIGAAAIGRGGIEVEAKEVPTLVPECMQLGEPSHPDDYTELGTEIYNMNDSREALADELGIEDEEAETIKDPRLAIADWLEEKGL